MMQGALIRCGDDDLRGLDQDLGSGGMMQFEYGFGSRMPVGICYMIEPLGVSDAFRQKQGARD
jgi:hypothetical protein